MNTTGNEPATYFIIYAKVDKDDKDNIINTEYDSVGFSSNLEDAIDFIMEYSEIENYNDYYDYYVILEKVSGIKIPFNIEVTYYHYNNKNNCMEVVEDPNLP